MSAAPVLQLLLQLPAVMSSAPAAVAAAAVSEVLLRTAELFRVCRDLFTEVWDRVDMDVFYHEYRPLIAGFYPDGVVLEGEQQQVVRHSHLCHRRWG